MALKGAIFGNLALLLILHTTSGYKTKEMRKERQKDDGMYFQNLLKTSLMCYHCVNAKTHEECNEKGMKKCAYSQDSCQTEVRMMHAGYGQGLVPRITKGCKQSRACNNNYMQNLMPGWPSTQCNQAEYFPLYVCRYCCGEAGCNSNTGEPHCRRLEKPENGDMTCMTVPGVTSSACGFKCDECFILNGSKTRTCKSDRMWSGKGTTCVYDPSCGLEKCDIEMTRPIENGSVECSKGNSVGSICEFSCSEDYHILGTKRIECSEDDLKWDSEKPICEEADTGNNPCNKYATFEFARDGALSCKCRQGFEGDGSTTCDDIDECSSPELNTCHELATCTNTVGSYICKCNPGFTGDGFECNDVNECVTGEHDCDVNGICKNAIGSYDCICAPEYIGDGRTCEKNEVDCPQGQLRDGLYCICKNITTKQTTTAAPPTTKIPTTVQTDATKTSANLPATVAPTSAKETTNVPVSTKASEISNAQTEVTTFKAIVTTQSAVITIASTASSTKTTDLLTPVTDGNPGSENGVTETIQESTSSSGHMAISVTTDAGTVTEATTSIPKPDIDWCVSFEQGVQPVMKTERMYKEINDILQSRVVPSGDNTTVILGPWIGLDDRFDDTQLRWRDGCEFKEGQFNKWAPGEPRIRTDEDFQNCVHLISDPIAFGTRDFMWKVVNCSDSIRYSCDTEKAKHSGQDLKICKPRIGNIANGKTNCSDGWNVNSICTFTCNPGFVLKEPYSATMCWGEAFTWTQTPPTCIRPVCSPPLSPPNEGEMTCSNDNQLGSTCNFTCNQGYRIQGDDEVTCLDNQQWSSSRPCCRDDCPPFARMNLIFVLDSSSSVGRDNFYDIKQFVKDLQKRFVLSIDFTQVTAMVYHSDIVPMNDNKIYDSKVEFEEAIGDLPYEGVGTYTGKAIDYVTENFVGKRAGAKDVVVLLTDGKSLDDVIKPANRLRQENVHVIAVGVKGARWTELEAIASKPTDDNIVTVDSFVDLEKTVNTIKNKVCNSQC